MKYAIVKQNDYLTLQQTVQHLKEEIREATAFIKDIEDGKLDAQFGEDLTQKKDNLAQALISMRQKMIQLAEDERQRNWVTEGLANFVDILRANNDDLKKLSDSILKNLVKYIRANQGWLFIYNDNDARHPFLELSACYAYDRKKYVDKQIKIGEGMVGQTFLEKETVYMVDIPKTYPHITSGLGEAVPAAVLLVPLKVNEEVFGILELGTFHKIPDYQIRFVEKLAESIASTIANTKVNERTRILLQQTQEQTEQLRSQEEEMRQNMEELHATQEEMERKSSEIESRIEAINQSNMCTIDFDVNGNILTANNAFLQKMGYTADEIRGKHHRIFVQPAYEASPEYAQFWKDLKNGISKSGEFTRITKSGQVLYLDANYTVMKDNFGQAIKVIKIASDTTETKKLQAEIEQQAKQIAALKAQVHKG